MTRFETEPNNKNQRKSIEKNDSSRSTKNNTLDQNTDHPKRKKEKVLIVAKNKKSTNNENKN